MSSERTNYYKDIRLFRAEPHSMRSVNFVYSCRIKLNKSYVELISQYCYYYFDACEDAFVSVEWENNSNDLLKVKF